MKSSTLPMMLMTLLTAFTATSQTTVGVTAGASFANVKVSAGGISASPKDRIGIVAGVFVNAALNENISFHPEVNFVQKGYSAKDDYGTEKVNFNYIDVPLNIVYNQPAGKGIFVGAGPSVGYGFSGIDKFTYADNSMPDEKEKIRFGSGTDEVKNFEMGANFIAGYRFHGGFLITANYNLGLSKINNDDGGFDSGKIKNRYFGVRIGYVFGGGKKK